MNWFTSDLHFGHAAAIDYCKRPFASLEEMHEALIARWNERVRPEDTVYVLGDMALCRFKDFEPLAKRLNGRKFLIQGNHDHYSVGQYERVGFTVFRELTMKIAGRMCRLSHFPYAYPWYKRLFAFKSELRFMDRRPPRIKGETLLHGHTHTKYKGTNDGRIHVGVDAWNFYPVSQREIESILNKPKPTEQDTEGDGG
jgi:calcineurin-like phosphoesterase family protein